MFAQAAFYGVLIIQSNKILVMNERAKQFLGISADSNPSGKSICDFISEESEGVLLSLMPKKDTIIEQLDVQLLHSNGSSIAALCSVYHHLHDKKPTLEIHFMPKTKKGNLDFRNSGHVIENISEMSPALSVHEMLNQFKMTVEQSPSITVITNTEGVIEYCNGAFSESTGYTRDEAIGLKPSILKSGHHPNTYYQKLWATIMSGEVWKGEFYNRKKTGDYYWESAMISPLKSPLGEITHLIKVSHDFTQQRNAEIALVQSEEKFRNLYETMAEGVALHKMVYDDERNPIDYRFLDVNTAYENDFGILRDQIIGELASSLYGTGIPPHINEYARVIQEAIPLFFETYFETQKKYFHFTVFKTQSDQFATVVFDITQRKQAEIALQKSEATLNSIFRAAPVGIGMLSYNHITQVNQHLRDMTGYQENSLLNRHFRLIFSSEADYDKAETSLMNQIKKQGSGQIETCWTTKTGKTMEVLLSVSPLNQKDISAAMSFIALDISGRKQSERRMLHDLQEKEVLLKEIHHRVKNNLQIIISLLNLQSYRIKDKEAINAFKDSKNRIHSMALVHEAMYQSQNLQNIDLQVYIKNIVNELSRLYTIGDKIKINLEVESVHLDLEKAIPCALILNELLTNSIKHAFPDKQEGQITVRCAQDGDNCILMTEDNGVGLPVKDATVISDSLGLKLVDILTEQLEGTVSIHSKNGACFKVEFPM